MSKNSFNSEDKATTKGTGAGHDKKTVSENTKDPNSEKAQSTKPNLQDDNSIPGQKGPQGNGYNSPK